MAKIELSSVEQRELFGLDAETVLIPSQQSKKQQKKPSWGRDEARTLILRACTYHELTIREIAKELDRAKSPHLRAMVYELCHDGLLVARKDITHNNLVVYKFIAARK